MSGTANLVLSSNTSYELTEGQAAGAITGGDVVELGGSGYTEADANTVQLAVADTPDTAESTSAYASGDRIRVIYPQSGCLIRVKTSRAANITQGTTLAPGADGALVISTTRANIVAIAEEALTASSGNTALLKVRKVR